MTTLSLRPMELKPGDRVTAPLDCLPSGYRVSGATVQEVLSTDTMDFYSVIYTEHGRRLLIHSSRYLTVERRA